jgi:transposase
LLESFGCDMEHLVGWRGKRRRCHTLDACPIASPSVEKWRLEHPHDTPPYPFTPSPTSAHSSRQVAQEFIAGETLHGLAKRHDVSRNLIRIWVRKYEEGAFDDDARAADLIQEYEARIAALERLVGKQALELEFLKGAMRSAARPRSGTTSVITGPAAFPSPKDAG